MMRCTDFYVNIDKEHTILFSILGTDKSTFL